MVHAPRRPTLGQRQGGSGEGDDMDDRRADSAGPASGQWMRTELRGMEHDQPPEGMQGYWVGWWLNLLVCRRLQAGARPYEIGGPLQPERTLNRSSASALLTSPPCGA